MQIYNTLSRRKEEFIPSKDKEVRMYVCGPNLYGPCHVGHAMSYIFFDVLRRYLEYRGYTVQHVQNFTDIEDRIIETAQALGISVNELAERYIERFWAEMDGLNVKRAHHHPRATEVIDKMLDIIQGLMAKGHAYVVDGDVYFRVTSDPDYGKLSGRTLEEMQAGARIEVDPRKEHPMDFALWKAAKPGEPSWDSPWGQGRPGWHIECSAMAMKFLGEQIDIHGGGQDVLFPHHENEIAQSESYTGRVPFAKYWVHNGLLRPSEEEEKMTRHLANFVSIQEALERYSPDAIRLFILSSHYRSSLTWSEEGVLAAERGGERLRAALRPPYQEEGQASPELAQKVEETHQAFQEAMDDDLNTAQALATLFDLARAINQARDEGAGGETFFTAQETLKKLAGVLGLKLEAEAKGVAATPFIDLLVSVRDELRAAKLYPLSDKIREELSKLGVILEDGPGGTTWRWG
ncbi:MAG TPA: cysteine--tRNA ligase [Chloroflexi bacterium]|nr:cysteine--tRNA ligase [Chloroflexota bacterium]